MRHRKVNFGPWIFFTFFNFDRFLGFNVSVLNLIYFMFFFLKVKRKEKVTTKLKKEREREWLASTLQSPKKFVLSVLWVPSNDRLVEVFFTFHLAKQHKLRLMQIFFFILCFGLIYECFLGYKLIYWDSYSVYYVKYSWKIFLDPKNLAWLSNHFFSDWNLNK